MKPNMKDAPPWAKWLLYSDGLWWWCEKKPLRKSKLLMSCMKTPYSIPKTGLIEIAETEVVLMASVERIVK